MERVQNKKKKKVFLKEQLLSEGVATVTSQALTLYRNSQTPLFLCAEKMKLATLVGPLHWGLLHLCIAGLCIQLVSSGNQSSRGQTGGCQTPPDQPRSPKNSL